MLIIILDTNTRYKAVKLDGYDANEFVTYLETFSCTTYVSLGAVQ